MHCDFLLSQITHSESQRLPCCEDTQEALRGVHVVRTEASRSQPREGNILKWILQPQASLPMTALLTDILTTTSWQILACSVLVTVEGMCQNTQRSRFCGFLLTHCGIIRNTAMENRRTWRIPHNNCRLVYLLAKWRFPCVLGHCSTQGKDTSSRQNLQNLVTCSTYMQWLYYFKHRIPHFREVQSILQTETTPENLGHMIICMIFFFLILEKKNIRE